MASRERRCRPLPPSPPTSTVVEPRSLEMPKLPPQIRHHHRRDIRDPSREDQGDIMLPCAPSKLISIPTDITIFTTMVGASPEVTFIIIGDSDLHSGAKP
ncbi:unnamed protein product [Microthlaspi erraticum]|uniref:Uncharacterized protein n=1 Tax=Microthlaspi erraticum TaxID=1685480 RepID=A0A6D2JQG6_9BRAS|nr:unnamed protein product [Microthlaspi erraticum]